MCSYCVTVEGLNFSRKPSGLSGSDNWPKSLILSAENDPFFNERQGNFSSSEDPMDFSYTFVS